MNKALGSRIAKGKLNHYDTNTGASNVSYLSKASTSNESDNIIDFDTLDNYVSSHNIDPKEIKYLWIDTEGFEPEVFRGASRTLSAADIPIFMEFTPYYFSTRSQIKLSDFVDDILAKHYSKYIINGTNILRDIHTLTGIKEKNGDSITQFDILLVK